MLRPYQQRAVGLLRANLRNRPLLCMPTGAGKTVVAAEIARLCHDFSKRTLFLCDRREIVLQTAAKFTVPTGVILSGHPATDAPHQIAAVQTLTRRNQPPADLIFVDECRLSMGATTRDILESYPDAFRIGFDATPVRMDGQGLGALFGTILEPVTMRELQDQGYLARYRYFAPVVPDLARVRRRDFTEAEGETAMMHRHIAAGIVDAYLTRRGCMVLFACTVKHSLSLRDALRDAGVRAEHVDANTSHSTRQFVFQQLRERQIDVVCNVDLVGYGFDAPDLDGVILARPTRSLAVHRQQCGRALRPGKEKVIIDGAGNAHRLGTPDAPVEWDLAGGVSRPKAASIALCRECYAVFAPGGACPACGAERTSTVKVTEHDVPIREVKYIPTKDEKRDVYRELLVTAHMRGYAKGWAAHQYRSRFGVWPTSVADLVDAEMCSEPACLFCDSVREARQRYA
jgi:superfamily II DNA or RNA helicase